MVKKAVYYMSNENGSTADGAVLVVPGTDVFFTEEYHIFSIVVRKSGVTAGPGSSAGATVPDRYAFYTTMVKIGKFQPPIISLQCVQGYLKTANLLFSYRCIGHNQRLE